MFYLFRLFFFLSFHSTDQILHVLFLFILVCSVRVKSINGPNVRIVLYFVIGSCVLFFTLPISSRVGSASCYGTFKFLCILRSQTYTAKIYNTTVWLLRLLLLLLLSMLRRLLLSAISIHGFFFSFSL